MASPTTPVGGVLFANYNFKSSSGVKSLFGNSAWVPPSSPDTPASRSIPFTDKSSLGYLAFPNPKPSGSQSVSKCDSDPPPVKVATRSPSPTRIDPLGDKHRARIERERAEIIRGEEDWVRSGGILRDSEGRRDFARTEQIREEIRLREWENAVQGRWDRYERRWTELQTVANSPDSELHLTFGDIPWPVYIDGRDGNTKPKNRRMSSGARNSASPEPDVALSDLTLKNIEIFLTDPLHVRGCKVTRKERIRSSFLRWHPDKMTALVSKVVEQDRKDVEDGISAVVRSLQEMNSKH
ncbi:hypothetical protein GYMLUDRAFT_34124 [Collybiopsis luxurians FD-317 M1]|nr:hypothetical protein GYMLUDRAFT_34124 [Collybiopsis luxurians FD-317 M1]